MTSTPPASVLCVGTTPAAQRVMVFQRVVEDAVNRAVTTLDGSAGKGINVAKVLRHFAQHPIATGFVGGDTGARIVRDLEARGIEVEFVTLDTPTRQCTTVIDQEAGTVTELVQESPPATAADFERLTSIIQRRLASCRALVLSGTIAAGGPPDFYGQCVRLARGLGVLSIVDAQGAALRLALEAKPGLVKPNHAELAATVGHALNSEPEIRRAMSEILERGAERIVVTAGRKPALACEGGRFWRIYPAEVRALNPIGSGDSFTAALAWRLLRGDDLGEACRWGAAAGAANALNLEVGELAAGQAAELAGRIRVEEIS